MGDIVTDENTFAETMGEDTIPEPFFLQNYVIGADNLMEGMTLRVGQC